MLLAACSAATIASAPAYLSAEDNPEESKVFELGEIVVKGTSLESSASLEDSIDDTLISELGTSNIAEALNTLPGVTFAGIGARNEQVVYVRGFDARQVPIYVDGVPVSVPYDGYGDLGRFTTADIASITLYKGYSSVLAGPNAMGGVINIVSRKPVRPFEFSSEVGVYGGNGRQADISAGTKMGKWYAQASVSYNERDDFILPDDFKATTAENGDHRENSYQKDLKISGKVGYTPNETDEYTVGFVHQKAEKGNPPYAGTSTTASLRYWQWPEWDKTTVYYTSMTRFGESYIHPRFYYDRYDNTLDSFDDATYTTMSKKYAFESIYDDYSYGASVEGGTDELDILTLKSALHYKVDHHDQHDKGKPHYTYEDSVWSTGLEATTKTLGSWQLVGGIGYDWMTNDEAVDTNTGKTIGSSDYDSFNPSAVLFYNIDKENALHLSVARKSRFPTLKDRFSYKMGSAIPNPSLGPETVLHYEAGYSGQPLDGLTLTANVFLSNTSDTIESVANAATNDDGKWVSQNRNVGESRNYGFETGLSYTLSTTFSAGANYTCISRRNVTSPELKPTSTPRHSGTIYANYHPFVWMELVPYADLSGMRYSDTAGTEVDSFVVLNAKAIFHIPGGFTLDVGVRNIGDTLYEYSDGYPEEGRTWYSNLRYEY
jgi:iron complex outermembrane receptor protein